MIVALRSRRRLPAGQKGFTLIELLVVLAIIAILAAIVTFGVVTFLTNANTSACQQERSTVQSAMDAMLSSKGATGVATQGTTTNSWTDHPVAGAGGAVDPLAPSYLRNNTTKWSYSYGLDGKITGTNTVNGITC